MDHLDVVTNGAMNDKVFNIHRLHDDMLMPTKRRNVFIVRPEYSDFVVTYINRFFCLVGFSKVEFFDLQYDDSDKPCNLVRRSRRNLLQCYESKKFFMKHWLTHRKKREYLDVVFEPDLNVPIRHDMFNLYFDECTFKKIKRLR